MHRTRFPKPVQQYRILQFWGNNIVASEGEEWKRFRKISAPAFSEVCFESLSDFIPDLMVVCHSEK